MRARKTGVLMSAAGCTDIVDGSLVEVARDGDEILTTDPDDIFVLATAAKKTLIITRV